MSWEWFAGFFDGEGWIGIRKPKPGTTQGKGAGLVIGQVDRRPLDILQDFLRQRSVLSHIYFRPAKGNRQDAWALHIQGKSHVQHTLTHLLPFLIVKQAKAIEALGFLETMRDGHQMRHLTLQERDAINERYHKGESIKSLMSEYHLGIRTVSRAIQGPKRGNNHGYRICPQCGFKKRWSKSRDGQPTLCKSCDTQKRRDPAAWDDRLRFETVLVSKKEHTECSPPA